MDFDFTIIYVPNVQEALSFYEKAFGLKTVFLHESLQYGELGTGNTTLAFVSESLAQSNGVDFTPNNKNTRSAGIEIAFVSQTVSADYQHAIAAGAIPVKEPMEKPWGQTVAYVKDLNGVLVGLCSPI